MSGRRALSWALSYTALLLVVLATYGGTLRQFFIADDFAHLAFFREMRPPFYRYLDPSFSYSDPVTLARYLPVKLFTLLGLERVFGVDATGYHAFALAVHALNALLVGHLAWTVFRDRTVGVLSALMFATTRLNAQNVCWVGCIPNLVGATCLFAAVALYLRRELSATSWIVGPFLLLLGFTSRTDGVVCVAFLLPLWAKDVLVDRRPGAGRFAVGSLACAHFFAVASWISQHRFPEPHARLGFAPRRVVVFLADLFVPWEAPAALKIAVVIGVLAGAAMLRDSRVRALLFGIGVGALFWTVVVYLDLTPRYFYVYTALSSMLLAVLLARACRRLLRREHAALGAALGLGALLCGCSAWQARRTDVVWFDYLSISGRELMRLYDQQQAAGAAEPLKVRLVPYRMLTDADLSFFRPYVEVVKDGPDAAGALPVDTGQARFVAYYGEDFRGAYWRYPWLLR